MARVLDFLVRGKGQKNQAGEKAGGRCERWGLRFSRGMWSGHRGGYLHQLFTNATPLSKAEWKLSNLVTARCLQAIAVQGGPRCCKRDSFLAVITAAEFLRDEFGITLDVDQPVQCTFSDLNEECLFEECLYYYHT